MLVLVSLLALEDRLLYHPRSPRDRWDEPPPGLAVEDVRIASADGTAVHAWFAAPPGWRPGDGAVLFCHGKGGNVSTWARDLLPWHDGLHLAVLVFDYPGYGKSGGTPNEAGCYAAADAAYAWLTDARGVPAGSVLLYGFSLGGAVAADLAARVPHRALVLAGAFTSFPDVAQGRYPWLPARRLARNRFDGRAKVGCCRGPVFVAHDPDDSVVPFEHGQELLAAAPGPKHFHSAPGVGHRPPADAAFFAALRDFLDVKAPLPGEK
jgi:pimeloyl-ACP methyl ester carboxylesterase